jgi:hypothetical protein
MGRKFTDGGGGTVDVAVVTAAVALAAVAPSALEGGCAGSLHAATIGSMAPMAER